MGLNFKEGYNNVFGVRGGLNALLMTGLVPMTPLFNMVVTIHAPILPIVNSDKEIEIPDIKPTLALALLPQYKDLLVEGSNVLVLFNYFFEFAKEVVDFELIGYKKMLYEQLVAYHTAHHFQTHIEMLKDEANKASLNAEVAEKDIYLNDTIKLLEKGEKDDWFRTQVGRLFVDKYEPFVINKIKGGYGFYGKYTRL